MIETFTIIIALIAFLSIFYKWNHDVKKVFFWIFIIFLTLFDGLRWETGTDWQSYHDAFMNSLDVTPPGVEIAFVLYTWAIRSLTDNYSIYLLITTAIIYIGIFYTVFQITNYSFISVLYLTATISWYSGSLRQMIASVFFIIALTYIYKQKVWKFLLTMSIGALFHNTIFPFFVIYWMYNVSLVSFVIFGILLMIGASLISFFIEKIDYILNIVNPGRTLEARIGGTLEESSPVFGLIRKTLTIGFSFFFFNTALRKDLDKDKIELNKVKFFLNLSALSLIFYIVGTFFISFVSSRLDIYPGIICLAIYLGLVEKNIRSRKHLLYLYIFAVCLSSIFYARLGARDLFHPYKSIFYNTDYIRELY